MIKNLLIVIAVLVPGVARAEFVSKKQAEVRLPAAKVANEPLTVDGMLDKINTVYIAGLRRCYTKGLAVDPTIRGKVTVTFTVNPWGRVSGSVAGIAPKVDSCLSTQVAMWKFPSPRNDKGGLTEASFKISLLLAQ